MASDCEKDLPLMANTDDVLVSHYCIDLACSFETRSMSGSVAVFLCPVDPQHVCDECRTACGVDEDVIPSGFAIAASNAQSALGMCASSSDNRNSTSSCSPQRCSTRKDDVSDRGLTNPAAKRMRVSPKGEMAETQPFRFVLDACDITVRSVHEVTTSRRFRLSSETDREYYDEIRVAVSRADTAPLNYSVEKWCVKIWKDGVTCVRRFPHVVSIEYSTDPKGASLTWAADQDGRPCVFTQGAWINNRSLFPCQEPPIAMATWQATVTVKDDAVVLMTGDENAVISQAGEGVERSYYHYTTTPLMISMLALAVGYWKQLKVPLPYLSKVPGLPTWSPEFACEHEDYPCRASTHHQPVIPTRIFAPASVLPSAAKLFSDYIPRCLQAAFDCLGPHPFPRLDVLVLPRCFASLGMASPNLLLISHTLLAPDGSMCIRIAHEVCHAWFGLLLGAQDWTEEWLSEGFATFSEDHVHGCAMKWNEVLRSERAELRAYLRYRTLVAELDNTTPDLQMLHLVDSERGSSSHKGTVPRSDGNGEPYVRYVKNGMNPEKSFTQVHYLKGYFLLRHLAAKVGCEQFYTFLRRYVWRFHGQLVLSQQFFAMFFETFPDVRGLTVKDIYRDWLDCPGMPAPLAGCEPSPINRLYQIVLEERDRWRHVNRQSASALSDKEFQVLEPDQLVLLLELLLELDTVAKVTLASLRRQYRLTEQNADVRHRWCELVVKHHYYTCDSDVATFLADEQSMGVYMYGELLLSSARHRRLVRKCFDAVAMEMDANSRRTVAEMFGNV
ncbi:PREDICTED: aminopeptidase O-like isoform X2 [Priapulus caudatus]|uniref:Aminopeptidase O-like isoform X2 n=1 Tax=Priapulus caudatus TaxID=37621 RepID=A0ABM1E0T5_PRICU|nr:PREDICTED: aminopeptidase O-like isoform X2 [Priapulus caudatus]